MKIHKFLCPEIEFQITICNRVAIWTNNSVTEGSLQYKPFSGYSYNEFMSEQDTRHFA